MIIDVVSSGIVSREKIRKFIFEFAKDDNWHEIDRDTGNLGYAWIHYAFIRIFKPKKVLCVGSRYGYIPAICALACKDNGEGCVDFVDASYDQNNAEDLNHWGGVGYWKTEEGKNAFKKFGLNDFIQLHVLTTREFKKKYPKRKWGYMYLDGDHSYDGIKNDFTFFYQSLLKKGVCSLHDINTQDLGDLEYGVNVFWRELCKSKKYNILELPGETGLGIIQKI